MVGNWYEDPPEEPKERPAPKGRSVSAAPKPAVERIRKAPELVAFEALQKRMDDLQRIAYMNPTEDNVRNYLEMQAFVVEKSSYFADVCAARRVGDTRSRLYGHGAARKRQGARGFQRRNTPGARPDRIRAVAEPCPLLLFPKRLPYCHMFAPYLREFEAKFGLKIEAVSLDGGALPEFPRPRIDNGIARTLDVKHVPALYLADPAGGRITPIGFGVLFRGRTARTYPGGDATQRGQHGAEREQARELALSD